MTDKSPQPAANGLGALVENISAPEVFASEASFFAHAPGIVTITFCSYRFDNSQQQPERKRVVVGRLVMPILGAQRMAAGLYDYLQKIGLDPLPKPPGPVQ